MIYNHNIIQRQYDEIIAPNFDIDAKGIYASTYQKGIIQLQNTNLLQSKNITQQKTLLLKKHRVVSMTLKFSTKVARIEVDINFLMMVYVQNTFYEFSIFGSRKCTNLFLKYIMFNHY